MLRRIMRRAIRAMRLLGWSGAGAAGAAAGGPGLHGARPTRSWPPTSSRISSYAYGEEEAFLTTLRGGHHHPRHRDRRDQEPRSSTTLSGDKAFQLHDTYGFPIDLTLEIAAEQGLAGRRGGLPPADGASSASGPRRTRRRARPATPTCRRTGGCWTRRAGDVHRIRRDRPRVAGAGAADDAGASG